jgi:hypothetical protein
MIGNGGIALVEISIPDLMGASGLSVKLEATPLQAFHHFAVGKSS